MQRNQSAWWWSMIPLHKLWDGGTTLRCSHRTGPWKTGDNHRALTEEWIKNSPWGKRQWLTIGDCVLLSSKKAGGRSPEWPPSIHIWKIRPGDAWPGSWFRSELPAQEMNSNRGHGLRAMTNEVFLFRWRIFTPCEAILLGLTFVHWMDQCYQRL